MVSKQEDFGEGLIDNPDISGVVNEIYVGKSKIGSHVSSGEYSVRRNLDRSRKNPRRLRALPLLDRTFPPS